MSKNNFLLLSTTTLMFFFTGCAERGYVLTSTPATSTITAQMSSDIRDTTKSTKDELSKMKAAVKKELKKKRVKKAATAKQKQKNAQQKVQRAKEARKLEQIRQKRNRAEQKAKELRDAKALKEKKRQQFQANKAKALEEKRAKEARLQKEKEIEILKAKKKESEAKALEQQLALEKKQHEAKRLKELEAAKALEIKKQQEAEILRKKKEEKNRRDAKILKEKQLQALQNKKHTETVTVYNPSFTQPLRFKRINKTYQKFGTSELHGHVIYLDHAGQEIDLRQKNVYLLPVGAKINYWYNNYYLKNKGQHLTPTAISYLNSTTLDLNKNFNFFGVPAGTYYIVIESLYPGSLKKVYIAKKINVGKYKKVMAVFSKKL